MRVCGSSAGVTAALVLGLASAAAAGPRVVSLDQCADQFVLALAPRGDIAALSYRARQPDSYLRASASGLPLRRADLESVLAVRPAVVVREWGGDAQMAGRLASLGVTVVGIDDAADFAGVRANIRRVAAALGRGPQGETLIAGMDTKLAAAGGAGRGRRLLYLTSGGFTAGRGTLVAAMIQAAGYANAASAPGFEPVSLERLALEPPDAVALGFFDPASVRTQHWSLASSPVLNRTLKGRVAASLPADILGCPAWFAADGAQSLAAAARGRR